jgi:hypothetical protein
MLVGHSRIIIIIIIIINTGHLEFDTAHKNLEWIEFNFHLFSYFCKDRSMLKH